MLALVTGGGGFLGRAIVKELLAERWSVRSLARGAYPELDAMGVDARRGDLTDADAVRAAVEGCDVVFHVAALAGVWGAYETYYAANVTGTQHVIAACREHGIGRLVFTSSPSVVLGHDQGDIEGADESLPYPQHYATAYPETKARAERAVLAANDGTLHTVSLRPHLIWGPGDNHIVPRVLAQGKSGKLRIIGAGDNRVDTIYIDNAASAHLLAAKALAEKPEVVGGRAYFISQDAPVVLWDIINGILSAGGVPPVTKKVPFGVAMAAATVMEFAHRVLRRKGEPRMTRFVVRELATAHWFDISAAKRDLGYEPTVSIEEGLERLKASLAEEAK